MVIRLIDTGYFYADGGAMFGVIPQTAWSRRYPSEDNNSCVLAMRTLLICTDEGRVILIDNGAGNKQLLQLDYYRFFNMSDLHTSLRNYGIEPEQVTDMILTHLHFDHCGYTTHQQDQKEKYTLAFPNATHWVGKKQWENFLHPNALERDSYFPENMQLVEKASLLQLVECDMQLCDCVQLRLYDGHTPAQLVPYITTAEQTFVFAGDVIPLAASISPQWISAYDTYPVTSYTEKIRMLDEAVEQKQAIIYCHDAYTSCSTIKKVNHFYVKDQLLSL
ncbi:MBL fold metallo-hydrolase [Parabacteroides sp. PF5-9]|uniref:MBL fold metallo-hydrolase n=1 Tax=Parabacteroides sp. PF5-9 TaxID=1742404 RepID=UPI00247430BC|nr:MBL fold metallo-hydrolase [Parabacteroides sp. PF5-9]MDH6358786.1 glyoxylase-like metal-dependent hydrolase (beta-lactamase superfamily II) [Parabacteroides sp. PF5-9]